MEPGSRRSPGGAVLMLAVEPGSRRSPGGAALADVVGGARPRRSPGGAALADGGSAVGSGCGYFIPNTNETK